MPEAKKYFWGVIVIIAMWGYFLSYRICSLQNDLLKHEHGLGAPTGAYRAVRLGVAE